MLVFTFHHNRQLNNSKKVKTQVEMLQYIVRTQHTDTQSAHIRFPFAVHERRNKSLPARRRGTPAHGTHYQMVDGLGVYLIALSLYMLCETWCSIWTVY